MEIFPAIDLRNGNAVRLTQGDYDRMEVYNSDPKAVAQGFRALGAKNLHVVDLDGAKDGKLVNYDTIKAIVEEGGLFIEVGGGIRDEERIRQYLDIGVNRVILGTAAVTNLPFLKEMVEKYGAQIAVGVDAKDGFVAINGWKEITDVDSVSFCQTLTEKYGVKTVIYTDISKDGAMQGTNLEVYEELNQIEGLQIVASGGISYLHEIETLHERGTYAAIVGKAIYTGALKLEDVLNAAGGI